MQEQKVSFPKEEALLLYHRLVEQLEAKQKELSAATDEARQIVKRFPSMEAVEHLLREADERYWYAPRQSWQQAHIAHLAAQGLVELPGALNSTLLLAESVLTLGVTTAGLGRFAEAVSLLSDATQRFLTHDKVALAIRANSEMAMGCTYLGQFDAAQAAIASAKEWLVELDDPLAQAYCERAEGLFHLMQNRYREAVAFLGQAGETFYVHTRVGEAALTWYDMALAQRFINTQQAQNWLNQARLVSSPANSRVITAHSNYILALIYHQLNQYTDSLPLYSQVRAIFDQEGMKFHAARSDIDQGLSYYYLNQYEEALSAYSRARTSFLAQKLNGYVARCDLNIAMVYYNMNRYSEALTLYEGVAEEALLEGRVLRAARCYTNMGLCYDKLGRYDRALILHEQARHAFLEAGSPIFAAHCEENLAGTHRQLGRLQQAMTHYQQVRSIFAQNGLAAQTAYCDMQMADLYLALQRPIEAKSCLEKANQVYTKAGMYVHQAVCYRLLAQVALQDREYERIPLLLNHAQKLFSSQEMLVEVALCDLTEGEMKIAVGEMESAKELFQRALTVLVPGFPDQAWRAEEGLGQCARALGDEQVALDHYTRAATFIGRAREMLPTERLSSSFFARRKHVFQVAIELALELDETEKALALVEASKARTLLTKVKSQELRIEDTDNTYLVHLVEREANLRRELEKLRRKLTSWEQYDKPLPPIATRGNQSVVFEELVSLSQAYEEVVDQLRLIRTKGSAMPSLPFSTLEFREAATRHLSSNWLCLVYFLVEDKLIIFSLSDNSLKAHSFKLTSTELRILSQCASNEQERRELIYRGTLRGFLVPGDLGRIYRQQLGQLLLPPALLVTVPDVLILVPHGILHGLPFHALFTGNALLVEKVPVLYAPSLQILQTLWGQSSRESPIKSAGVGVITDSKALICGLETFPGPAHPLPHVKQEVQTVVNTVKGDVQVLYQTKATVSNLKHLNITGELAKFDLVHLATHAITESVAPTLSRVLLADNSLTVADILDLKLSARLVTLSSCQAAVGEAQPGDEMMTLARAFFYAGAQAVVASLWSVEDEATEVLMQQFYQRLQRGKTIPQALRQTQLAMHRAGYSAYQWAPFIAIGHP